MELARPISDHDSDLLAGQYLDLAGTLLGEVIPERREPSRRFLLIVSDHTVAMQAEAALENDDRMTSRARRSVLRFPLGTAAPSGVLRDGDAWEAGDAVAYAFVSEEQATVAQRVA